MAAFAIGTAAVGCSSGSDSADTSAAATTVSTESAANTTSAETTAVETTVPDTTTPDTAATTAAAVSTTTPVTSTVTDDTAADGPSAEVLAEIDTVVSEAITANDLNGAGLVMVDAEEGIVSEQYWGDFDADRVSLVASSSKMVTATVVLGLASDGVVDLDAPLAEQVSWTGGNTTISLAELMSSQSGLVGLAGVNNDPAYPPYLCQFLTAGTLAACAQQIDTTPDDDRDTVPPGDEFRYGGAQWQVAGGAATDISGKSWGELLDEYLVSPCGLDSLGYTNHWAEFGTGFDYPAAQFDGDPADLPVTDNPSMEGGLYIDPIDYAELLLMHLRGGSCGDTEVVDPALIERAHTNQLADGVGSYGFGWFVDDANTINDPGAFGSVAWLDLDDGVGAWLVIEDTSETGGAMIDELEPLLRTALGAS